eukprot:7700281-Ditylum_brightwellii.AAC.1
MHLAPTRTTTMLSAILDNSHFQYGKEKEHHDFDAMEKQIVKETVLHDTVEAMYTPQDEVNKICSIKNYLKENMVA